MNELKVYSKFVENLSKYETLTEKEYIDCCIKSIMGWNDKTYWERINEDSKNILKYSFSEVCNVYRIRASYESTNEVYRAIYGNNILIGGDGHYEHLCRLLLEISEKEAEDIIKKKFFWDYRVSHIWPCTKNIYLNNLPFNFFAIPSFCYCLSDDKNGGDIGEKFRIKLKKYIVKQCSESIKIYNNKIIELSDEILKRMNKYLDSKSNKSYMRQRFKYVLNQFILIPLNNEEYLEDGLKIFEYDENKVKFTDEYLKQKEIGFKDFI